MGTGRAVLKAKKKGHWKGCVSLPESSPAEAALFGAGGRRLPAVDHDGPGLGGVQELDLAHKAQEAGGIAGDAVVGPAGEVEQAELPDLVVAFLRRERASVPPAVTPTCPPSTHGEHGCRTEEPASLPSGRTGPCQDEQGLPHRVTPVIRCVWEPWK